MGGRLERAWRADFAREEEEGVDSADRVETKDFLFDILSALGGDLGERGGGKGV
jgi:hypothetical protein